MVPFVAVPRGRRGNALVHSFHEIVVIWVGRKRIIAAPHPAGTSAKQVSTTRQRTSIYEVVQYAAPAA
jgi:hypothetical protein